MNRTFLSGLLFGSMFGITVWPILGLGPGIIVGLLTGVLFGRGMGGVVSKLKKNNPNDFSSYKLDDGETVVNEILANHTENRIAVGGKILFTNSGVRFIPHTLMGNSGSQVYIPYVDITKIYIKGFSLMDVFSGGLVKRLAIGSKKLEDQFFVVSNQQEWADYLNQKIAKSV
jgi:hypothetical protein